MISMRSQNRKQYILIDIFFDLVEGVIEYFSDRKERKRRKKEAAKASSEDTAPEAKTKE